MGSRGSKKREARAAPSRTRPTGEETGYAHAKCYAKDLADCDTEISREHYISDSALKDLGGNFLVTRARLGWEEKRLPASALTANILCRRHNSALSSLDEAGRKFMRCLRYAEERAAKSGGRDVVRGVDVERWFLKMLCGYTVLDGDPVPLAWQRLLFGYEEIRPPCGLHVNVAVGSDLGSSEGVIEFASAYNQEKERVGCAVTLHGYRFLLGLDGKRIVGPDDLEKEGMLHLREIKFGGSRGTYHLVFDWPRDRPHAMMK